MKNKQIPKESKGVLMFDAYGILIAVFRSVSAAGEALLTSPQGISNACTGATQSASGFYFRHLSSGITIESDDLGKLEVEYYDKIIGEPRLYKKPKRLIKDRQSFIRNKIIQ